MNKFALIAAATLLGACTTNPMFIGQDGGDIGFDIGFDDDAYLDEEQQSAQGRIMGDMPTASNLDTAASGYASVSDGFTYASIDATGDFGWAMVAVSVEDYDNDGEPDYVDVIGCGSTDNDSFDQPADSFDITTEETIIDGEPVIAIDVDASFGNDDVAAVIYIPNEG